MHVIFLDSSCIPAAIWLLIFHLKTIMHHVLAVLFILISGCHGMHVTSVSLIWSHLSALYIYGGNEHATSSSHPQHCRISGLQLVDCFSGAMHFVAGQLL